jgi:hypothetical protein
MKKIFPLIALCSFVFSPLSSATAELIPTKVEDSYFASADIMAQGTGICELSGTQIFTGECDIQLSSQDDLKSFTVVLDNDGGQFRLDQINNGTSNQYITNIDGQDVPTTMDETSLGESTITMEDLTLHVIVQQLFVRTNY